tara:strand:- start:492 stop:680 length:189 start_codon:yes stop_codon:yes gene_type:complete
MQEYELEGIDIELYQISKNEARVTCVSCKDSIKESEDYTYVCEDIYCESCLIDADLIAYKYG